MSKPPLPANTERAGGAPARPTAARKTLMVDNGCGPQAARPMGSSSAKMTSWGRRFADNCDPSAALRR